jgi:hypothetical protein
MADQVIDRAWGDVAGHDGNDHSLQWAASRDDILPPAG